MMLPAFRGVAADARHRGPDQSARLHPDRQAPAQSEISRTSSRSASAWPFRPRARRRFPCGVPKTGFMIESMVTATAQNIGRLLRGEEPTAAGDLERRLPRRLRRLGRRLRRPAADPAAQRQLVVVGQVGARRQDRLREVLPAQDPEGHERDLLREARARRARHRQAEADGGSEG